MDRLGVNVDNRMFVNKIRLLNSYLNTNNNFKIIVR